MNWADLIADILRILSGRPKHDSGPSPVPDGPPTPDGPPMPTPGSGTVSASHLVSAINAARVANGLPPLASDPMVSVVSQAWAARMARVGTLSHGDFFGRIASVRPGVAAGEDIGEGFPTAEAEVQGWVNDPPHRVILLGTGYTAVGCGVARGSDGSLWYVADFLTE